MKAMGAAAMLAACVALAGCDRFGSIRSGDNAAANAAAVTPATGGEPASGAGRRSAGAKETGLGGSNNGAIQASAGTAAGTGAAAIDRAYMMGRWTDHDEDCDKAADFFADGRFVPASGPEGLWSLNGDRLSIVSDGNTFTVQLVPIDRNSMTVINADGSLGQSSRC